MCVGSSFLFVENDVPDNLFLLALRINRPQTPPDGLLFQSGNEGSPY